MIAQRGVSVPLIGDFVFNRGCPPIIGNHYAVSVPLIGDFVFNAYEPIIKEYNSAFPSP